MKFRIYWLEYHDPMNWVDWEVCEKLSEINEKIEQNGIKNITESLPTKSWQYDPNENDGWIEVSCEDTFEANSIEEAKKYVEENYDIEVFSVWQETNYTDPVFTEEDLVGV